MENRMQLGRRFRELVARPQGLVGFGVGNAMEAKLAEHAGAECVYAGGYTIAMYKMMPDMGMMNMVEVWAEVSAIAEVANVPVIADVDEGYGNALNAQRTAAIFLGREFVDLENVPWRVKRLAGIHIEDQRSPKRCGHIAGKDVVSLEEFVGKIKAVCRVRDTLDKDSVVIARTDAYHSTRPGSLDDAIARAVAAAEAGADMAWYEDNRPSRPNAFRFAERIQKIIPGYPLAFNYSPSLAWFTQPNPTTFEELVQMGYKFIFITIAAGHASSISVYEYAKAVVSDGAEALWEMQRAKVGHATRSHHDIARVPMWQEYERQYIPGSGEKQHSGEGFGAEKK